MILTILIVLGLFIYSLTSINNFYLANILIAILLPTLDRWTGGLPITFASIKYPVMFIGMLVYMLKYRPIVSKNIIKPLVIWLLFLVLMFVLSHSYRDTSLFKGFNFTGLSLLPLILVSSKKELNLDLLFADIFNYIFLPVALFGLFQYIIGPVMFKQLGFSLVTPNTMSVYSVTFYEFTDAKVGGLRPFSFLVSSADFSVLMFHACLWSFILSPKKEYLILPVKYMRLIFIVGLFLAQFITLILITIFCVSIYKINYIKKIISLPILLKGSVAFIVIISLFYFLLPEPFNRFLESLSLVTDEGRITSLGYRFIYITRYPRLIYGHAIKGHGFMMPYEIFSSDCKYLYFTLFTGVPLTILYVYILVMFLKKSYYKITEGEKGNDIYKLAGLVFLAILINDLSNGQIEASSPSNFLVWTLAGLIYNPSTKKYKI